MKKSAFLLALLTSYAGAAISQTMFSVINGKEKYEIPMDATITTDGKGFVFNYDGKNYQLPLGSRIGLSANEKFLPVTLKGIHWKPGVSSLQSGSNGLFSRNREKFVWNDDFVAFSDYDCSGTVVDTVMNVRLDPVNDTRFYGDVVDVIFYKVQTGETGNISLPSNTLCDWKQTTHVGKYAALIISYGIDSNTGGRMNNVVGVAKWFSQLDTYTGVSGKQYNASGTAQYFDDLETAKDIVLNMKNFSRSVYNGEEWGSLSAPTWNYLSEGDNFGSTEFSRVGNTEDITLTYRRLSGNNKPTADELEAGFAVRFDSPDRENVISDYYFTASDPNADFQYPELKSAPGQPDDQYKITECNVWKGGTCLYMVPSNGTTFSKYRKFNGYIHVRMTDGSEYSRHLSINKSGVITADENWTKDKDATLNVKMEKSYEDNGKLQYYGLCFLANILSKSNGLEKNVMQFDEAHAIETDLNQKGNLAFIPKANIYVPYSYTNIKPSKPMHYCNYSFVPLSDSNLGSEIGKNGVALTIGDDINSTYYERSYKYFIFTDDSNHIVNYTVNECGGISFVEWFE